jgi:TRAP-type C4-dicarboxylate transport system permease small subunit
MEIIYYVGLWGAALLGGLLAKRARARLPTYLGLCVLFAAATVALYLAFSQWAGVARSGSDADTQIPQDYLKHGAGGFVAFAVLIIGVISPAAAVWTTGRLKTGRASAHVI